MDDTLQMRNEYSSVDSMDIASSLSQCDESTEDQRKNLIKTSLQFKSKDDIVQKSLQVARRGRSNRPKSLGIFADEKAVLRRNRMMPQQVTQSYKKKWIRDNLPAHTRRRKWFPRAKPIEKDQIVIICDKNNPRNRWPKGIVIDTVIAKKGQGKQATIKPTDGDDIIPATSVLDFGSSLVGKLSDSANIPGRSVNDPKG